MMNNDIEPFLYLIAKDLINRFGTDLSQITVVFPSRRARLFFNNYLYHYAGKPVWAPSYLTIDELFENSSDLYVADNIKLIALLYETYIEVYNTESDVPSVETLDEFYFFGEILLNDFDDVDKNLVDAHSLFRNLKDLDQLKDDFLHLNETQIEAVIRYFQNSFQKGTRLQEAFWSVWNILGKVYSEYKKRLKEDSIAYLGMLMRSVIEENKLNEGKQYVFAGFNVLNQCEKKLFKQLKECSLFYWDTDRYYLESNHEAGRFIRENILQFGSAIDINSFDFYANNNKKIKIISSSSESGQSAYIFPWINDLNKENFTEPDTAIVLCNEQILPSVMHAIPSDKVDNVNITMGFPFVQSPIYGFLQVVLEMQIHGYIQSRKSFRYKYILPVLRHPYTRIIFPESKMLEDKIIKENIFFPTKEVLGDIPLFSWEENVKGLSEYLLQIIKQTGVAFKELSEYKDVYGGLYQESIFRAYQVVSRFSDLIASGELNIEKSTFLKLLKKMFSGVRIPFHGEPVKGLQVMGLLETRNLDFKNIVLFSVNEGYMPGTYNENTFIPQFLRKHFGLSTVEHQESVYAYYFYRLLQRAENITLLYNNEKTQTGKAEMSRFLLQMLVSKQLKITRYHLSAGIKPIQSEEIIFHKDTGLLQKIREQYDINYNREAHRLSPSALNTYINCSLRFYLQYIEGIKNKEEFSEELDNSTFGTIFHRAAELLYRDIGGVDARNFDPFLVTEERLKKYLSNDSLYLNRIISRAFEEEYFKKPNIDIKQYNGEQLINFRVIRHLMRRMIRFDMKRTPFYILGLEQSVTALFDLPEQNASLKIGGIIDRLEEKDGTLYIVDYKTSGKSKTFNEMSDLYQQKNGRASHAFQTFLYSSVLVKEQNSIGKRIVPSLLYLQEAGKDDYSSIIQYQKEDIEDFNVLYPDFEALFTKTIGNLFDPNIPFQQTVALENCKYCDFKDLCNRP